MKNLSLAFIGGGNMARCIIGGLLEKRVAASNIMVSNPGAEKRQQLASDFAVNVTDDNHAAVAAADIVVLAVKPQILREVATDLAPSLKPGTLVISVAAAITCASIERWLGGNVAVVRAMPNTPSQVLMGATGLFANTRVTEAQRELCEQIFGAIGISCWVARERDIDAVTAIAGSAPAYFFFILEAMAEKGAELGLDFDSAKALATQTMMGAAALAQKTGLNPAELRKQVTSPGGTTERAIAVLRKQDLDSTLRDAMDAVVARAAELSTIFDQ